MKYKKGAVKMKNYDEFNMTGKTYEDCELIANALENDKQLFVNDSNMVVDVDGNYIADCKEEDY